MPTDRLPRWSRVPVWLALAAGAWAALGAAAYGVLRLVEGAR